MALPAQNGELDLSMGTVLQSSDVQGIGSVNTMQVCTYNESHVCGGGRYATHVEDCRRKFLKLKAKAKKAKQPMLDDGMQVCEYNRSHHVHKSVMWQHIYICEGYYKYRMEIQKDPPSMIIEYPRYVLKPEPYNPEDCEWIDVTVEEINLTDLDLDDDDEWTDVPDDYEESEAPKEDKDEVYPTPQKEPRRRVTPITEDDF